MKIIWLMPILALILVSGSANAFTLTIQGYHNYNGYYWGYYNQASQSSSSGWTAGVNTGSSYSASSGLDLTTPLTWNWGDGTSSTFSIDTIDTALNQYTGAFYINGVQYPNFYDCSVSQYQGAANSQASTYFAAYQSNGACVLEETHDYTSTGVYDVYMTGSSPSTGGYQSNTITYVAITAPTISGSKSQSEIDSGNSVFFTATINYGNNAYIAEASDNYGYFFLTTSTISPTTQTWTESPTTGYYSNGGDMVTAYDPVSGSYTNFNFNPLTVFPDISISSSDVSITQTPSPIGGGYVNSTPITLSVSIPEQTTSGYIEPAPTIIVNWGDSSSPSQTTMSESGSNYVISIQHTYSNSGSDSIAITVESYLYASSGGSIGSEASTSVPVTINPYILPSVSIIQPNHNVCQGEVTGVYNQFPATFTISSTTGSFSISYFDINWGDGSNSNNIPYSSSSQTISHTYSSSGSYTITITAYDNNGKSATTQVPFTVNQFAYPSTSINPQSGTATISTTLAINLGKGTCNLGILNYNFGDGTLGNSGGAVSQGAYTLTHTYQITQGQTSQQYTLSGTISDDMGNTRSASAPITITYQYPQIGTVSPTSVYNTPSGSTYSNTFSVGLTSGTNPLNQITWNFGDSSTPNTNSAVTVNTQTHSYTTAGTYNLVVTATDSANYYNTSTTSITVNPYPYPIISNFVANSSSIYQGIDFAYNATATQNVFNITKIVFNFGASGTDGDIQTVYTNATGGTYGVQYEYPTAGNYTATATVYDQYGVSNQTTLNIMVIPYQPPILTNFSITNPPNLENATITTLASVYNITAIEGSYPIQSVQFNWGDGTPILTLTNLTFSNNETVISEPHTYNITSGAETFNLQITAYDSQGLSHSIQRTVTVYPYTKPSVTNFQPTAVLVNNTIYYSVNVTAGTEQLNYTVFNFAEGTNNIVVNVPTTSSGSVSIPILLNETYQQLSEGYVTANVTVYDILGNSTTLTSYIYTQALPTINQFQSVPYTNSSPNASLFINVPTTFLVNISQATNPLANFTIFFGDGASTTINSLVSGVPVYVNHTYVASGSYEVQLQVYDTGFTSGTVTAQPNLENTSNEAPYSTPMTIFITENPYQIPYAQNVSPQNVYSVIPNSYNFSIVGGSFNASYMNVSWGDGNYTYNSSINSLASTNVTLTHTYAYSPAQNYQVNATVCDVFGFCSTRSFQINTTYQIPSINSVSITNPLNTSTVYALVNTPYDFNITIGTFPLSSLSVNFGDGYASQFSINDTNTTVYYTYPASGTFTLTASAQDTNAQLSNTFVTTVNVSPYIPPQISQLTPTQATAGLTTNFTATVTQGLFPVSNVTMWWQGLNPEGFQAVSYSNITNGTNYFSYMYNTNGTFFVTENITDIMGVTTQNTTIMTVNQAPWTMTPVTQTINYILQNSTPSTEIAPFNITFQNVTLPVNVTVQQTTIAGAYLCYPSVSAPTIVNSTYEYQFQIYCTVNPYVVNYPSLPIDFMITARASSGVTNNILVIVNLISKLPPAQISTPFNPNLYVVQPLPVQPAVPITSSELILIVAILVFISAIAIYLGLR